MDAFVGRRGVRRTKKRRTDDHKERRTNTLVYTVCVLLLLLMMMIMIIFSASASTDKGKQCNINFPYPDLKRRTPEHETQLLPTRHTGSVRSNSTGSVCIMLH
jgi:hypothetical protein